MTKRKFGAQIYTVRDHLQNDADFAATMHALSGMGFQGIHLSGVGSAVSEDAIVSATKDAGIAVVLTHMPPARLIEDTDAVIEYHQRLGCSAIGVGCIPYEKNYEGYMRFFDEAAPAIEKIHKAGMIFLYHNHHYEFARHNGRTLMDYVLDVTDPETCKITFDAYWAHFAGMDETQFICDHGDRVFVTHTKDMVTLNGQPDMTEMLTGNLNYDRFFDACDEKGIVWHFVEQDVCRMDTLESIRISRENLIARYGSDHD